MDDKLKGGIADDLPMDQFDPRELRMGIAVEKEHTEDATIAKEIAADHLREDPKYYSKLKQIHPDEAVDKMIKQVKQGKVASTVVDDAADEDEIAAGDSQYNESINDFDVIRELGKLIKGGEDKADSVLNGFKDGANLNQMRKYRGAKDAKAAAKVVKKEWGY